MKFLCVEFLIFSPRAEWRRLTSSFFVSLAGYSFFDSGDVALLGRKKTSPFSGIGK